MTVETSTFMDHVRSPPDETVYFEIESTQNNENIYPLNGGRDNTVSKFAIRPQYCNGAPLFSRTMMNPNNKVNQELTVKCGAKDVLGSRSSPVNRSTVSSSVNLSSPVKRSCTDTANLQHSPKSFKVFSPCPSAPSSSSFSSSYLRRQRLSHSVDSTNLQTALKQVQARDNLSSSCFAEITSEKSNSSDIDSELTCLSWLQGSNLLKEFSPNKRKSKSPYEFDINTTSIRDCHEDLKLDITDPLSCNPMSELDSSLRKPAYSFSTLIFMAIESAPNKRLPVKDIYQWIQDKFPYFQRAPQGWKNSIRHNLSLNKSFKKVEKKDYPCGPSKGSLWTIDHQARAGLVHQLRKTSMCAPKTSTASDRVGGGGEGGGVGNEGQLMRLDRKLHHRRDATGRFVPNHDDAEFDVAAAMCALGSSLLSDHDIKEEECPPSHGGFDHSSSEELLQRWRTCIEPNYNQGPLYEVDEGSHDGENINCANNLVALKGSQNRNSRAPYTIEDFVDEVHSKLSFRSQNGSGIGQAQACSSGGEGLNRSFNVSMDEDYEFDRSDDESSEDEEMRANMIRLVEQENEDNGSDIQTDSGYSEDGTPLRKTHPTMLDHSYSRSVPNFPSPPTTAREAKGVDALLHLANLASRELENLNNLNRNKTAATEDSSIDFFTESSYGSPDRDPDQNQDSLDLEETASFDCGTSRCCESPPPVETAEKSCQYDYHTSLLPQSP